MKKEKTSQKITCLPIQTPFPHKCKETISFPIVAPLGDAVETYGPLIRRYIGDIHLWSYCSIYRSLCQTFKSHFSKIVLPIFLPLHYINACAYSCRNDIIINEKYAVKTNDALFIIFLKIPYNIFAFCDFYVKHNCLI